MDSDKKRVFLERMRANPFHNVLPTAQQHRRQANASDRSSRNDDHFYAPASSRLEMFSSGFRSLSSDSKTSRGGRCSGSGGNSGGLFCGSDGYDDDDGHPPLQMCSIDGGLSTQVVQRRGGGDVIDTFSAGDGGDISTGGDPFNSFSQFSLSTPAEATGTTDESLLIGRRRVSRGSGSPTKVRSQSTSSTNNDKDSQQGSSSPTSYSSLRNKIKCVQEKYKKSSVGSKLRTRFAAASKDFSSPSNENNFTDIVATAELSSSSMSKYRSHSHGALHHLSDFEQKFKEEEDAIEKSGDVENQDLDDVVVKKRPLTRLSQSVLSSNGQESVTTVTIETDRKDDDEEDCHDDEDEVRSNEEVEEEDTLLPLTREKTQAEFDQVIASMGKSG